MITYLARCLKPALLLIGGMITLVRLSAQTDIDALMMAKNNYCSGFMYSYSSWKDYWEGEFKRDNKNLGTVSTQMIGYMGNYGISNKLNAIISLPYVITKASAGTMQGMKGIQDLSLFLKYKALEKHMGTGNLKVFGVAGFSFPLGNYSADFLPLSIGLESKTLSLRVIADYQVGYFFITGSGTYMLRDNIKIDRDNYFTTEMHYTNEVKMPDVFTSNLRAGYRSSRFIAEALMMNMKTLGGFDITKNNMPFPSNEMNATSAGVNFKYEFKNPGGFALTGGASQVIAGRNVGQATSFNIGAFYVLDFNKKKRPVQTKK
jgi:hypothetical protein